MTDRGKPAPTVAHWYTGRDDVQSGPFTGGDIEHQILSGHLRAHDLIWREGWPQWRQVGDVFSAVFSVPVPVPPPLPPEALQESSSEPTGHSFPFSAPASDPGPGNVSFGSAMSGMGSLGSASPFAQDSVDVQDTTGEALSNSEVASAPSVGVGRPPWREMTWAGRLGLLTHGLLVLAGSAICAVLAYVSFDILKSTGFTRHHFLLGVVPVLSWLMLLLAITRLERRWLQIVLSLLTPVAIGAAAMLLNPKVSMFWGWLGADGPGTGLSPGVMVAPGAYPEREPLLLATLIVSSLLLLLTGFPWPRRGGTTDVAPDAGRRRFSGLGRHVWLLGFFSLVGGLVMLARDPAPIEFFRPPLLQPHDLQFNSVALSADGRRVLTSSNDGTARIWDLASHTEVLKMQGGGAVRDAVFDTADERVAAVSADGAVRIWNAGTGALVKAFAAGTKEPLRSVAFDPAGTRLVVASDDGLARIFDSADGSLKATLKGHEDAVSTAVFSADGTQLLTVSAKAAKLWSAADGKLVRTFDGFKSDLNYGLFHPGGREVLISEGAGDSNLGHIVDVASGKDRLTLDWAGFSGAFSRDGRRLAVSGSEVSLYDTATGRTLGSFRYSSPDVFGTPMKKVALDATGGTLVTTLDRNAAVWDAKAYLAGDFSSSQGNFPTKPFPIAETNCRTEGLGVVRWLALPPNGHQAMAGTESGIVMVCSADATEVVQKFDAQGKPMVTGAISPDGKWLAAATWENGVRLLRVKDGGLAQTLQLDGDKPNSVSFSRDGNWLAVGTRSSTARVFVAEKGTQSFVLEAHSKSSSEVEASFGGDGQTIVTRATDGQTAYLKLWNALDGKLKRSFTSEASPEAKWSWADIWGDVLAGGTILVANQRQIMRISRDGTEATELYNIKPAGKGLPLPDAIVRIAIDAKGQRFAAAFRSGALRVLDIASGKVVAELFAHAPDESDRSAITSLTFHPSGEYLLSAGYDGTMRLWDIAAQTLVATKTGDVGHAAFSSDGKLIVAAESGNERQMLTYWTFDSVIGRRAATDTE